MGEGDRVRLLIATAWRQERHPVLYLNFQKRLTRCGDPWRNKPKDKEEEEVFKYKKDAFIPFLLCLHYNYSGRRPFSAYFVVFIGIQTEETSVSLYFFCIIFRIQAKKKLSFVFWLYFHKYSDRRKTFLYVFLSYFYLYSGRRRIACVCIISLTCSLPYSRLLFIYIYYSFLLVFIRVKSQTAYIL